MSSSLCCVRVGIIDSMLVLAYRCVFVHIAVTYTGYLAVSIVVW